jgi:hypothetical protein
MATISVSLPADGETIDAADYNTPINTIVNVINGNLDSDNLAANAVGTSEIADITVTNEKLKSTVMFRGTTTQTVTNSVSPTNITTYTEVTDRGADFNHTTGLFTAPYDGDYWFGANVGFENVVIPRMGLRILANSVIVAEEFGSSTTNTYDPRMSCSAAVAMTAGQTAYISVYQDSGGNIALHSTSSFSGYLIGRV